MPQPRSALAGPILPLYHVRGKKVVLDDDLARSYGVRLAVFREVVRKRSRWIPSGFLLRLAKRDIEQVQDQRKKTGPAPQYAFASGGVALISSFFDTPQAVQVNLAIMRDFLRLHRQLYTYADLPRKWEAVVRRPHTDEDLHYVLSFVGGLIGLPARRPARAAAACAR